MSEDPSKKRLYRKPGIFTGGLRWGTPPENEDEPFESKLSRARDLVGDRGLVCIGLNGIVAFDGDFVTIIRTGVGTITIGSSEKRIPVSSVTAVQWRSPVKKGPAGWIQFSFGGGNERRSTGFGRQGISSAFDENTVRFNHDQGKNFQLLRTQIDEAIAAQGPSGTATSPATPQIVATSVADELKKLAELRDSGVLTEAEFDAQKAKLLESG